MQGETSILAQSGLNLRTPGIDAALEIEQIVETFAAQKSNDTRAAHAGLAIDDRLVAARDFPNALRDFAKGDELGIRNLGDLALEWLAHIEQRNRFVRCHHGVQLRGRNRWHGALLFAPAELLVVDRRGDAGRIAANGTIGIATDVELAEAQCERVDVQ